MTEFNEGDLVSFELSSGGIYTEFYHPPNRHLWETEAWTPAKWYSRRGIRNRLYNANHVVQQWIHDHLTRAHCDC
jgi:hypothetical protein